jgi:tetratricopeptide (TPR) repeat protein
MTKKKRQRKERARQQDRQQKLRTVKQEPEELDALGLPPDPRAMERMTARIGRIMGEQQFGSGEEVQAFMSQYLSEVGGSLEDAPPPTTPLERAQELIYDAFDTRDTRKRVKLAEKALEITEDCADAYVLLAEETAEDAEEAKDLYEAGTRAGERALGEVTFTEEAGHFWGILETRPYMRAREGLAHCLWELGLKEEAVEHYQKMLELNPDDNQGIRYEVASCLLNLDWDERLGELLQSYEEEASAFWVYTRALWAFRQGGDSEEATAALEEAVQTNPHVAQYLLGWKGFPEALEELMDYGEEGEAVTYFVKYLASWLRTPGAVEWLRDNVAEETLASL